MNIDEIKREIREDKWPVPHKQLVALINSHNQQAKEIADLRAANLAISETHHRLSFDAREAEARRADAEAERDRLKAEVERLTDAMSWSEAKAHEDAANLRIEAEGTGMTWQERIDNYHRETGFPKSLFIAGDGRVVGTWIMGNDYRVKSQYYGGYPAGYLRRVKALFPDLTGAHTLHLFSGRVDRAVFPGATVDVNEEMEPDYLDDAQTLENVPLEHFGLVLADPPYSIEDAVRYQTTMVKRNKVMEALGKRLSVGAHVVWLDQVLPMFRKDQFAIDAVIGMVKSTNHRFRVVTIFRKLNPTATPPAP